MATFLDLAGEDTKASAPKSFLQLAGEDAPKKPKAVKAESGPAKFNTNDPAAMREDIVKSGDTGLLAAFDAQFPKQQAGAGRGMMPASAYVRPAPAHVPGTNDIIPGAVPTSGPGPEPSFMDKAGAVAQAGANTVAGAVGGGAGMAYGALEAAGLNAENAIRGRPFVDVEQQMTKRAQQFTPELPQALKTPLGQEYTENVGQYMAEHGPAIIALQGLHTPTPKRAGAMALQDAFEARKAGEQPVMPPAPTSPVAPVPGAAPVTPGAAPAMRPAPRPPQSAAPVETLAPIKLDFAKPEAFADQPAPSGPLNAAAQSQRAEVLRSVGLETARKSAIADDRPSAATDAQTAKLDSPAGHAMRAQLEHERGALADYADRLVRETGGTTLADQTADYARGTNITHALDTIKNIYDDRISGLYKVADERAQGVPSGLDTFRTVLGDDSQMTNSDRVHLRGGIQAYAKKLGIIGDDGKVFANAQQAETMRKYLNENWSPANSKFVSALKDAIDDDVTKSAGEDVYGSAREMRAERGRTLDNPKGIAKLMDSSGPDGINRAVATEKIPSAISSMPVDQLAHVVDTLRSAPPEAQPQAMAALNDIKSHFANQVRNIGGSQAGQYNAKGIGNYLRNNAARMSEVFTPEEMQGFYNLHQAAQILAKDQSYPGAAVQGHNLVRSGAMAALQHGATAAGAAVAGPLGASVGSYIGGKTSQAIGERGALKAVQKRVTRLADFPK